MLELIDVAATYHVADATHRTVFRDVSFAVERGEILALLGPSGCGKSTLLRVIAGLFPADAGQVRIGTSSVSPRVRVVFQDPHLLPWLDVQSNVRLGLRYRANRDDPGQVSAILDQLDIASLATARVDQLSGGQAQRVALARALVTGPELLLLDEPFAALDPATRAELQSWIAHLSDHLGLTMVFVTHDVAEAFAVGDQVAVMHGSGNGLTGLWPTGEVSTADVLASYVTDEVPLRAALAEEPV